jgi:hypothetical protein
LVRLKAGRTSLGGERRGTGKAAKEKSSEVIMPNPDRPEEQFKAREELVSQLRRLLIGPMEESEILENLPPGIGPADYYLTGILWPRYQPMAGEEDESVEVEGESREEGGEKEETFPLFNFFRPSSMGLTCSIIGTETPFEVVVRGAKYERKPIDPNDPDRSVANWERKPFEYLVPVSSGETRISWNTSRFLSPSGMPIEDKSVTVHMRRRKGNGILMVTASLINSTDAREGKPDQFSLYQTEIAIRCPEGSGGKGRIVARPAISLGSEKDKVINDLLYREFKEFAVGHSVAVSWTEPIDGRVSSVKTDWLPRQAVSSVSAEGHEALEALRSLSPSPFSAEFLASLERRQDIVARLLEFSALYEQWVESEALRIKALPPELQGAATENIVICRSTVNRMRQGIEMLSTDENAFRAFYLANRAMDNQARGLQKSGKGRPLVWRPFQLAFFLLTLSSIVDERSSDRSIMDLLWFPTGGGKTEAYLGLTAFLIFYLRLRGLNKMEAGHVDVLMRYTLRLLTVQQFQRAAAMICAADQIRRQDMKRLGTVPISLGLYVGDGTTPNKLKDAMEAIEEEKAGKKPLSTPRLLLDCPLCGRPLPPASYKVTAHNMAIRCMGEAKCPSGGEPLPIFTVDEVIYQELPSLLIGTVDKFAQLPRKKEVGFLFGYPGKISPQLIIQDELHLISGPLGTMTGLYETTIDMLSTRNGIRPKIIGSTATIGRASQQVRALFDRQVMQFPPPAIDAANSFFAVRDVNAPDRIYLGLSSAGRSPKFTLQAATAAILTIGQALLDQGFDEALVDPYWTLLLYFNSLRELGGAEVMMRDDVLRSMRFYTNRLGCTLREIEEPPLELTSRVSSTEIPEKLKTLNFPLDGDPMEGSPTNTVLASNMISVGVDIPRLGVMLVNGQPKATSEYIQATSRVGRVSPGVILISYNAARPRDISHFEHFRNYHQALYRQVEATSVTPWSSRARDKALHAVLASSVRHYVSGMAERFAAREFDSSLSGVDEITKWIVGRAATAGIEFARPDEVESNLDQLMEEWERRAKFYKACNSKFEYWATRRPIKADPVNPHLMRGAEDLSESEEVWMTPNSMREVEPSAYFTIWGWTEQLNEED